MRPDEAGSGATPAGTANAPSLRTRPGCDQTTSAVAATIGPTPTSSSRSGRDAATSPSTLGWWASPARRSRIRQARARIACAVPVMPTPPVGRQRAHVSTICAVLLPLRYGSRAVRGRWREGDQLAFGVAGHLDRRTPGDKQGCNGVSVAGRSRCGQVVAASASGATEGRRGRRSSCPSVGRAGGGCRSL